MVRDSGTAARRRDGPDGGHDKAVGQEENALLVLADVEADLPAHHLHQRVNGALSTGERGRERRFERDVCMLNVSTPSHGGTHLVEGHKLAHGVDHGLEDLDALGVELVAIGAVGFDLRDGVGQRPRGVQRVEEALALFAQRRLVVVGGLA